MLDNKYDWQPYFGELAEKLLEQKSTQAEFGQWLDENTLSIPQGEYWNPISIIQLFLSKNKDVLRVDKQKLAELLKERLEIEAAVPKTLNVLEQVRSKTYIYSDAQLAKNAHDAIWPFFEDLMTNDQPTQSMFRVFETKHIASDIFSACFFIKPEVYMPISERVRYLDKERKLPTVKENKSSNPSYEEYLAYRDDVNLAMKEWPENDYAEIVMQSLNHWRHDFQKICAYVTNLIANDDYLACGKSGKEFLWIGTKDAVVGDSVCHYEIVCENAEKSGHTKDKIFVEIHCESKKAGPQLSLLQNVEKLNSFKWRYFCPGFRVNNEGLTINDYDDSELAEKIVEELRMLNSCAYEEIKKIRNGINSQIGKMDLYNTYITLLKENYNLVLTGAPGTGKTYLAKEIASYWIAGKSYNEIAEDKELTSRIGFVQFHPSYDYTDFVEGLRPIDQNGTLGFERRDGYFKAFCKKAIEDGDNPYIMIIDETNRGELSKIFGELFYSIDPGYRGVSGKVATLYQNMLEENDSFKDGFFIPENVYIIGTMNDIDRSVESMDFAMRRRFVWQEVTPDSRVEMLDSLGECKDEAKARMKRLNEEICKTQGLGAAFQIGPAYFRKLKDGDFSKLWKMNLEPLLREYLRGMSKVEDTMKKFESAYNNQMSVISDALDPTE